MFFTKPTAGITLAISMIGAVYVARPLPSSAPPLKVLIVGGGPDPKHNQVAIESNVRYVNRILPKGTATRVLFTNGDATAKNVLIENKNEHLSYRLPQLPRLDGPSRLHSVKEELSRLAQNARSGSPVLLYFTGHGSPDRQSDYANNQYDLWAEEELHVSDLAKSLSQFPQSAPITLVMVECFSGAFGNVLFENGDPTAELTNKRICGFFASLAQREAAGCTPEVNEANYRDFTGYFFAALTGTDRLGNAVKGVDYNHDGKIGMDEAYCYTLLNDESIDTPVCTSDVFLRRFVRVSDEKVFGATFSDVRSWASPAQLIALDGLSTKLNLQGENRLHTAFSKLAQTRVDSIEVSDAQLFRFVRLAKSIVLSHVLADEGERSIRDRYAALLALEASNPLRS